MAVMVESPSDADSGTFSWETGELPPAEIIEGDLPPEMDNDPGITGADSEIPANACRVCGLPVERKPGSRGRLAKTHPECRPLKTVAEGSTRGATGNSKAEREAKSITDDIKSAVVRGCIMLAAIDRFDAFAVMASLPAFCANLEAFLVSHPTIRTGLLSAKSGGSIAGVISALLMMVLPILAHHRLIPHRRATEMLLNAPFILFQLSQKLAEGEASLTKLIHEQFEQARQARQATTEAQNAEGQ